MGSWTVQEHVDHQHKEGKKIEQVKNVIEEEMENNEDSGSKWMTWTAISLIFGDVKNMMERRGRTFIFFFHIIGVNSIN